MAATPPPGYTPPPADLPQRGDRLTFSDRVDAWVTWFSTVILTQLAAMIANAYANALAAFAGADAAEGHAAAAAASAVAAASATAATVWASGSNYPQYSAAISPADGMTYRNLVAVAASAIDPALDDGNTWVPISGISYEDAVAIGFFF